jgi:hypothetical protein
LVSLSDSGALPLRFGRRAIAAVEAKLKTIQEQSDAHRDLYASLALDESKGMERSENAAQPDTPWIALRALAIGAFAHVTASALEEDAEAGERPRWALSRMGDLGG